MATKLLMWANAAAGVFNVWCVFFAARGPGSPPLWVNVLAAGLAFGAVALLYSRSRRA